MKLTVLTGEDNLGVLDNLRIGASIECVYGDSDIPYHNEYAEESMGYIVDYLRSQAMRRGCYTLSVLHRHPEERDHVILSFLDKESIKTPLLIYNYPENFTHPRRQKKIADYLCELVNGSIRDNDINIVVLTLSPYIVQGIRYYAHEHEINVDYYLCERGKDNKLMGEKINNDLNRVFLSFAEPLNEMVNIGYKEEESPKLNIGNSSNITD